MRLTVVPVTFRQACAFIDAHHRHHRPPQGMRFALGVTDGTRLVGVATVGRPVARHLDNATTAEVTRACTDGTPNANSMLYAACWRAARALGYQRLLTYTQDGETGASLRAAGYHPTAHQPADPGWHRPSRPRTGDTGGVGRTRWEIHTRHTAPPPETTPPTITTAGAAAGRPEVTAGPGTPPFAYYGGKTRLAARIAALFPDHGHYVEPFAGSLAVLLAKPPARKETVNDLDQELVGFWRTLRDRPEQLVRACALTPHSRAEHAAAGEPIPPDVDEVERARRVWVRLTQGRSGALAPTGWKRFLDPGGPRRSMPGYLAGYAARMPPAAARLAAVSLECRPALEVIADYGTHPGTLLYVDPPYLAIGGRYRHRMADEAAHRELADALHGCRAAVVLSGYPSPLYERLYAGWHHTTLTATTHRGSRGPTERTEVLWTNRPPATIHAVAESRAAA
ncbi:MAG TPA: XF1762 family protein [Mycobacteriales bacterium]|nr:XF1762 family protein [Mycobacteriales bacterium]